MHFASKYHPKYTVNQNRNIHVFPLPGSSNDTFKVLYVNSSPEETDGSALDHASTGIKWFPSDKVYLVILYASIQSLQSALAAKSIPTVAGDATELTSVDDLDTDNTIDVHADQIEVDQWWSTVGHMIEDEEDTELAAAQLQKIQTYIQGYAAQLQGNTTDYEWMVARKTMLETVYDKAFGLMAPKQQEQQPQKARRRR